MYMREPYWIEKVQFLHSYGNVNGKEYALHISTIHKNKCDKDQHVMHK